MSNSERGRFSAKRNREAVVRPLGGEDLDLVSRDIGVMGATLAKWREAFLEGGQSSLRKRKTDDRDDRVRAMERKLGRVVIENELRRDKIDRIEDGRPLALRRSRK